MDRGAGQEVPRLRIDRVRDPLYFVLDILRVPRQPTLVRCEQSLDCCRCCSAMHALRRLCFLILRRWATNVVGLLIMALMGEWLCVQRELADIPLSESLAQKLPTVSPYASALPALHTCPFNRDRHPAFSVTCRCNARACRRNAWRGCSEHGLKQCYWSGWKHRPWEWQVRREQPRGGDVLQQRGAGPDHHNPVAWDIRGGQRPVVISSTCALQNKSE